MDNNTKKPISLLSGLVTIIMMCWVLPIVIVVMLAMFLLSSNYEHTVRQEVQIGAENAMNQIEIQFNSAFEASKAISYDGTIRTAYRNYQQDGDSAQLYSATNAYLTQAFSRDGKYKAVFISFWDDLDVSPYVTTDQTSVGYNMLRKYRENIKDFILAQMADIDTGIFLFEYDGELFIVRNLLDSKFEPYATVTMLCDTRVFFQSLDALKPISNVSMVLNNDILINADGSAEPIAEGQQFPGDMQYELKLDEHSLTLNVTIPSYSVWSEMPGLRMAAAIAILLVLPLLLVMALLFRKHITKPVEILTQASTRLRQGERGYVIAAEPPNQEFQNVFDQFNTMSTELELQFERSYQEQAALQKAKIKALQSQINPHFLNNTLEIISWEARLSDNERLCNLIDALSTMLDAALDRDGHGQISLQEEMRYVDAYLYIIKNRLGDGLIIEEDIGAELLQEQIPRLILQPLVENAVEHDTSTLRHGKLSIRARREAERIVLEVEHDGVLSEKDKAKIARQLATDATEAVSGKHVGLRNVTHRLKLLYADEGQLSVDEQLPGKIVARISFPLDR